MTAIGWILVGFAQTVASPTPELDARLLQLAHHAVAHEVTGAALVPATTRTSPAPVFVTLERDGIIRGCRGSLQVTETSLEEAVVRAAKAACAHDPRYNPVRPTELDRMLLTITIVERRESISNVDGLLPTEGLILTAGNKVGIVLPYEGKDPKTRLGWAYRKAGVALATPVRLEKLIARRFRG